MESRLLGTTVHFPKEVGSSEFYQGEIVVVDKEKYSDGTDNVQVHVLCTTGYYVVALLRNCKVGSMPETEEQLKERLRKRREKEGQ